MANTEPVPRAPYISKVELSRLNQAAPAANVAERLARAVASGIVAERYRAAGLDPRRVAFVRYLIATRRVSDA